MTVDEFGRDENGDVGQASLEDSNIAGIGSKENRDLRKNAAASDPALKNAGSKVGLEVWRVENKRTANDTPDFGIARVAPADYGQFFTGDSYIALNTYRVKDENGKLTDKLAWDVHFWLGNDSSQDEIGVAAYKTVEIDDLLDDGPIQHRETQGSESRLFQSYFKEIMYLKGGHPSGFRAVKPEEYEPRLLMIRRTKRTTRAFQIPVAASNMNHGDVFVLDAGLKIYLWVGAEANAFEKSKGANLQSNVVASRNGKARKVNVVDDEFWTILGGSEDDVRPADDPFLLSEDEAGKDEALDVDSIKLYRISDQSGAVKMTKEHEGKVKWDMLDSSDVFLVHANVGIWVWVGTGASREEKSKCMKFADKYIADEGLNKHIPVTRILQAKNQDKVDLIFGNMVEY
ncbi:Gelsolin-like protein 1 [Hondaea fermentalgiana]|uniref:Gelsolin-like protein 1 n=1 Tax=Hondaea fermentalgiana TaxID=2315210 RepID=A0A2R5GEI6_9STRA|nr:Gelsolin-like protein 1 [Hondaea fermentalgiana]|eukprot:GBG26224.1 Gelsolin-like protein 1 [Hondaea fermentalgiana]